MVENIITFETEIETANEKGFECITPEIGDIWQTKRGKFQIRKTISHCTNTIDGDSTYKLKYILEEIK